MIAYYYNSTALHYWESLNLERGQVQMPGPGEKQGLGPITACALGFRPHPLGIIDFTGASRCLGTAKNINKLLICCQIREKILLQCLPRFV